MSHLDPASALRDSIVVAAESIAPGAGPRISVERPPDQEHGDYSTNAAMLMAGVAKRPPREIAEDLGRRLSHSLGERLERFEVAGPGFLNLFMSGPWYRQAVHAVAADGAPVVPPAEDVERTIVEFVSANPTGPLTAASGRHAAYGDAVARLLEAVGNEVTREYYVNDGGTQVRNFAASIAARMTGGEPPGDGYQGEYVHELAERAAAEGIRPADLDRLSLRGVAWMVEGIRASLERFGVGFDDFFSERSLYEDGRVEHGLDRLRAAGHTYESEDALWLRTTEFGDDKDRVLVRSGGEPTYFGADVAYHADKLERGFSRLVDVLGADHHGYVARMAAAIRCLEAEEVSFEAQILQMIHLVEGGERAKMSKRAGDIVTLDELVGDIGVDAARFFMLQRSHDRTMDLDLDLARSQSSENPVYYVQYAYARIASILRKAERDAGAGGTGSAASAGSVEPSERALISKLLEYPAEVHEAAAKRAPHRICAYASSTAAAFHAFYRDCQVVGAEGDGVEAARLELCRFAKATLAASLALLGIGAPERM